MNGWMDVNVESKLLFMSLKLHVCRCLCINNHPVIVFPFIMTQSVWKMYTYQKYINLIQAMMVHRFNPMIKKNWNHNFQFMASHII